MKKTVIIHQIPHYPTPWGDAVNAWNTAGFWKGLGIWESRDYHRRLAFWMKSNFNIFLGRHQQRVNTLILAHFHGQHMAGPDRLYKEIDLQVAFDYLDEIPNGRTAAFATVFDEDAQLDHRYITENSTWICRKPSKHLPQTEEEMQQELDRAIVTLPDMEEVKTKDDKVRTIVWFFIYRTKDLPIYYIIPNPDMMAVSPDMDTEFDTPVRFWTTQPHYGSIGDIIFRPKFSKNVAILNPSKIVTGDKFWIHPFQNGLFASVYQEEVPKVPVKVTTNLEFKRDPDTNRVYFEFKEGQEQGYVNLRWNEDSLMGLTQSSRSLEDLENKCTVTYDVYRNSGYKYTGD